MDGVTRADEDLLLDLLNTTPVVDGQRTDVLADTPGGTAWARARGGTGTAAEKARLRTVRDAVADVVREDSGPETLAGHLEHLSLSPRLREGTFDWELQTPADEAIAARAMLAWMTMGQGSPRRLRPCANSGCRLFLHDRSNANTARWCSMATCGNRAKARRHYQRSRTVDD